MADTIPSSVRVYFSGADVRLRVADGSLRMTEDADPDCIRVTVSGEEMPWTLGTDPESMELGFPRSGSSPAEVDAVFRSSGWTPVYEYDEGKNTIRMCASVTNSTLWDWDSPVLVARSLGSRPAPVLGAERPVMFARAMNADVSPSEGETALEYRTESRVPSKSIARIPLTADAPLPDAPRLMCFPSHLRTGVLVADAPADMMPVRGKVVSLLSDGTASATPTADGDGFVRITVSQDALIGVTRKESVESRGMADRHTVRIRIANRHKEAKSLMVQESVPISGPGFSVIDADHSGGIAGPEGVVTWEVNVPGDGETELGYSFTVKQNRGI